MNEQVLALIEQIKERFEEAQNTSKYLTGRVFTEQDVIDRIAHGGPLIAHNFSTKEGLEYEFFTNNHLFGYKLFPIEVIPVTMQMPLAVVPREGCEDGIIDSYDKYRAVFKDSICLWSLDQIIEVMAKHLING